MTTTINNEHKKLNFSSEREQSQACLNSAEHEKNQGRKVLNVPNKREQNQTCLDSAEREGLRPKGNVPNLRFPEFQGEWKKTTIGEIATIKNGPFGSVLHAEDYVDEGMPIVTTEHFKSGNLPLSKNGIPQVSEDDYCRLKGYMLETDDIVFSRVGSVDINAHVEHVQQGWLFSGRVLRVRPIKSVNSLCLHYVLSTESVKRDIRNRAVGQTMPSINTPILSNTGIYMSQSEAEQKKIANLLSIIDERIATQSKIIDKLQSLIKGIRNDVFGKLRKNIGFNAVVGDVLYYEQPQSYIVEDAEYTYEGTPVLTANKAFVLGYTLETDGIYDKGDCIIFDDFTLDCKYVDFPFKVKSSAIKILKAKNKELLRYTFEFLKYLDLSTEEHKRHYIAETQNQEIILPTEQMVKTIAHIFSTLSLRMETAVKQRNVFEKQKQYLLRQMFI